jgi:hypothetical protein
MPHENTSGEHHPIAAAFLFAVLLVWWVSTFYACLGYNNGYQSGLHTTTVIQSSVTEINCNGLDEYTYATVRNNTGTSQDVAAQYINETCKSACGNPIWIAAVISRDISGHECYYFWFDEHRPRAKRFAEALPVGYQETVAYGWLKDGCTVANKTDFVWWLISCSVSALYIVVPTAMCALYIVSSTEICACNPVGRMLHTLLSAWNRNCALAVVQEKINSIMGRFKGRVQNK